MEMIRENSEFKTTYNGIEYTCWVSSKTLAYSFGPWSTKYVLHIRKTNKYKFLWMVFEDYSFYYDYIIEYVDMAHTPKIMKYNFINKEKWHDPNCVKQLIDKAFNQKKKDDEYELLEKEKHNKLTHKEIL